MVKNNFSYSVSVDCVIFGYDQDSLKVLLIKRGVDPYVDYWALPGDLVHPNENTEEAVNRVLKDMTGLQDIFTEQVKTFGDIGRHPLGRVFTVSANKLPSGRGFGEPVSLTIDLKADTKIISCFPFFDGSVLVASETGHGFKIRTNKLIAQTKSGKQIINVKGEHKAKLCKKIVA